MNRALLRNTLPKIPPHMVDDILATPDDQLADEMRQYADELRRSAADARAKAERLLAEAAEDEAVVSNVEAALAAESPPARPLWRRGPGERALMLRRMRLNMAGPPAATLFASLRGYRPRDAR